MSQANFTEIDTDTLSSEIVKKVEQRIGEALYPGDERRIFIDALAYVLATFASAANEQCKARMLPYAHGHQLDALGARYACDRIDATPSVCHLTFSLDTARPNDIIIPKGTTVTADNNVLFATDGQAVIEAGKLEVTGVKATATRGGAVTNGAPLGAIQTFVDKLPFVTGVTNTTVPAGGADGERYPREIDPTDGDDGTGDEHYRERIRLAAAGFSCAGSAAAYEYYAKSASSDVDDVSVDSNQDAGTVNIYLTATGGAQPTAALLDSVQKVVTGDHVKPMNDLVTVAAPEQIPYDIELCYYVNQSEERRHVTEIEGEQGLIAQYNKWQQGKIGRDINPQRLIATLLKSCHRVDISKPQFTSVSRSQIARFSGNINVTHRAIDDET